MKRFLLTLAGISMMMTALAQAPSLQVCMDRGYTLTSESEATGAAAGTYTWYEDGTPVDNSNTASLTIAAGTRAAGVYEYVRMAGSVECEVSSNTFTVTVNPVPAIHTASQTVNQGTPISTILYTASAGATISMTGSLPPGVNGNASGASFIISGTPSATGTFGYELISTMAGCTSTATAGTITVIAGPPDNVLISFCTQCCWDGAAWVNCYVTTHAYPFNNASVNTTVTWMGGGTDYYPGASSDVNGRANTAAITGSTGTSAVQLCKDLGAGWYLPAYEELQNMSAGAHLSYLPYNGRPGANLLATPEDYYWSSTEWYNNGGRYTDNTEANKARVPIVHSVGHVSNQAKNGSNYYVRCAWRP
jgi:hypothetical protein